MWFLYVFGNGGKPCGNSCSGVLPRLLWRLRADTACSDIWQQRLGALSTSQQLETCHAAEKCAGLCLFTWSRRQRVSLRKPQDTIFCFWLKNLNSKESHRKQYWLCSWIVLCIKSVTNCWHAELKTTLLPAISLQNVTSCCCNHQNHFKTNLIWM